MSKLRFGLIGLGNISDFHLNALQTLNDRAELSVICCRTESRGNEVAKKHDCKWVPDYRETFSDVDALIIATPHHLHYPMVRDALEAGVRSILLEKPIANSPEQVDELTALAVDKRAYVQVGYELRYEPALVAMKKVIDEKRFGKPIMALLRTEHGFPAEEFQKSLTWAGTIEELGGGVLFSHGCHYVDLLIWMLGNITEASCVRNRSLLKDVMEGEDSALANFRFESGAVASYMATWAVLYRELAIDLRIYCLEGQLVFIQLEDASTKLYAITAKGQHDLADETRTGASGPTDGFVTYGTFVKQLEGFLDAVESGTDSSRSLCEGRKSVDAIWSAYANSTFD